MLAHQIPPEHRAFWPDDHHDAAAASDRRSRYGVYLADNRHLFLDDEPTTDVHRFAAAAFGIALLPVMNPGYVHVHPRIHITHRGDTTLTSGGWDEDGWFGIAVDLAVPPHPITGHLRSRWRGRTHDCLAEQWYAPTRNDIVTALSTLTVRVPIPATSLPRPRYHRSVPDTDTAKRAVRVVCDLLNAELASALAALEGAEARR